MKIIADIEEVDYQLQSHFPEIPVPGPRDILGVAEEVGEFVGAYNKSISSSRNVVSAEEFEDEWADVIITTLLAGYRFFGNRTQDIVDRKMKIILHRKWRNR